MTYTGREINDIYEGALNKNITNKKVSKIKNILYEISDMGDFNVFSYHKLIYTLNNINRSSLPNLDKLRELYELAYKEGNDLPKDFYVVAALINSLYIDYSSVKKKEFKRLTEDICFLFPACNSIETIDLIKEINPMIGNLISESSLFFENRPSEYGNVMYAYTMNMMFAEMMVVFLENIDYYEYDYSLPSRVMHSLLENQKDAVGVTLEYSRCKDVRLFIKALFNVYKKEKGLMFRKEKEEYEKKKCILLS